MCCSQCFHGSIESFAFGEPEFTAFYTEKSTPFLNVLIWYKSAAGGNKYCNLTVPNNSAANREDALKDALQYATSFVKERWFLIEVTTPLRLFLYGSNAQGGYPRLRVTRTVEQPVKA